MQTQTLSFFPPAATTAEIPGGVDAAIPTSSYAPAPTTRRHAAAAQAPERAAALDRLANLWRADDLVSADPAAATRPTGFPMLDAELPGGGWPTGQLIELLLASPGIGELGLAMPALAGIAAERRSCVWVLPYERDRAGPMQADDETLPYPPALAAAGVDLARSLFVRPATPRESLWAIEQALRAPRLGAVIGWLPTGTPEADFRALRRLHLLAARHRALVFVLREPQCALSPSPASLRLQLAARPQPAGDVALEIHLLKRRGRPLIEPLALQVHPEQSHRPAPALPTIPDTPADASRPAAQPAAQQRRTLLSSLLPRAPFGAFAH